MRYVIEHETALAFAEPVREHQAELRLAPHDDPAQQVLACSISVSPETELAEHFDCFGNRVHRLSLVSPHQALAVRLVAEVETRLANPFDWTPLAPGQERPWLSRQLREQPRLNEFLLHRSPAVPELIGKAALADAPGLDAGQGLVASLTRAMEWMGASFTYAPGTTAVHAPLTGFLAQRAGVCQDFAHLLVALVRGWGFPARYAAGYVDPGALEGSAPAEAEGQATHAWAEVFVPGAGWRGFDAVAGLVVNDRYVRVAVGRDSFDAAPIRGAFKGDDAGAPPQVRLRVARQEQ